ncbi:MAG: 50S ribosomal protein L10 [Actinobacteria bacterium]|nr:50S ribosomal protein L10 [Actinomycetota bacterium]
MPNAEKVERVADIKERIGASDAILLTDYRGLTVSDLSELRRSLSEGGASFAVVKNTLMRRAAEDSAMTEMGSLLQGPTAVAFVQGDAVAAAKKVVEAIKRYPALVLKGGFMDGRMLSAADATALADLESREVMLSKIAGLMKGEMSRAASLFQAAQSTFLSLLTAYREKMLEDSGSETQEPETSEAQTEPEAPGAGGSVPADQADESDETTGAAAPAQGEE